MFENNTCPSNVAVSNCSNFQFVLSDGYVLFPSHFLLFLFVFIFVFILRASSSHYSLHLSHPSFAPSSAPTYRAPLSSLSRVSVSFSLFSALFHGAFPGLFFRGVSFLRHLRLFFAAPLFRALSFYLFSLAIQE